MATSPEPLSWAEIAAHLQAISEGTPAGAQMLNPNSCVHRYIRLRDIAEYLGVTYDHLLRVKRGETALSEKLQAKLSWYFFAARAGRVRKEQLPDGTWHIVSSKPQAHAHEARPGAAAAARPVYRIEFTNTGPRLKI